MTDIDIEIHFIFKSKDQINDYFIGYTNKLLRFSKQDSKCDLDPERISSELHRIFMQKILCKESLPNICYAEWRASQFDDLEKNYKRFMQSGLNELEIY